MSDGAPDLYELIDETPSPSSLPSRLYHLEPVGIGTPFIESLSSYVGRLAAAHCVSTSSLVRYEISPFLSHTYMQPDKATSNSFRAAGAMNGRCKTATEWVDALTRLTLRNDIISTTFLPFSKIVPDRGLLKRERSWCPCCLEDWKAGCLPIYEPLLWKVRYVMICPVHLVRLRSSCPNCGKERPHLEPQFIPGFCSRCGHWLGSTVGTGFSEHDLARFLWTANSVGSLLALDLPPEARPTRKNIMTFVDYLTTERTKGGMRGLARLLKVSHTEVMEWRHGECLPSFEHLMRMSALFKIQLKEVATMEFTSSKAECISQSGVTIDGERHDKKPARIDWEPIHAYLAAIVTGMEAPLDMAAVAERFHCSVSALYREFPALCQSAAMINTEKKRMERERYYALIREEIVRKIEADAEEGKRPSKRELYELVGGRGWKKEQIISEIYQGNTRRCPASGE